MKLEDVEKAVDLIEFDPVDFVIGWVVKRLAWKALKYIVFKTWRWWQQRVKDPSSKEE